MFDPDLAEIRSAAGACLGDRAVDWVEATGELTLHLAPTDLPDALRALRDDPELRMTVLIDICAVDWPGREPRFDVVYHLLSMANVARLRVKASVGEGEAMPTSVAVHPCANWYEREVFDMYGIPFEGHPDMRRLLTDYGFEGHPLRKDFPLTGFVEVRYDEGLKRVAYEPVRLPQEYRDFDFLSPWEGARETRSADAGGES